jgi:hypothetical protein
MRSKKNDVPLLFELPASGSWFKFLESLVISLIRSKFVKRCMSPLVVLPVEPVYQVLGKFGS